MTQCVVSDTSHMSSSSDLSPGSPDVGFGHCEHMLRVDAAQLTTQLCKPWMQTHLSQRSLGCQYAQECPTRMPNTWVCTHRDCYFRGCTTHMTQHSKVNNHPCSLHLSLGRIRCSICRKSVSCDANANSWLSPAITALRGGSNATLHILTGRLLNPHAGRRGFRNMGNTCFLSASLHALSNCPPLSRSVDAVLMTMTVTAGWC